MKLLLAAMLFTSTIASAQNTYWQQYLHYTIDARLNDREKSITGKETIVYMSGSQAPFKKTVFVQRFLFSKVTLPGLEFLLLYT